MKRRGSRWRALAISLTVLGACAAPPMEHGPDDASASDAAQPDGAQPDVGADGSGADAGDCDADHDGVAAIRCGGTDCDDADPHRFPTNPELCDTTSHDEDCDPTTFGYRDIDGDGHPDARCCNVDSAGTSICGDDCNDTLPGVSPDVPEVCNGRDDDCDTAIDEGVIATLCHDGDGDLFGDPAMTMMGCPGLVAHYVADCTDCSGDADVAVHPGATEVCDSVDQDCDAIIDEGALAYYADCDGDGFGGGTPACTVLPSCAGHAPVTTGGDCVDTNAAFHPGAFGTCGLCPPTMMIELCNAIDDDCDGTIDDGASASCPPSVPNGMPACVSGTCGFGSCNAGFHACSGACASNMATATCGALCTPCPAPPAHASVVTCDGTSCGFLCDPGWIASASACEIAPPRPIAPLSTATVTSRRPTLRWALAPGTDGAHVDICRDRACTMIVASIDVTGASTAPTSDLPTGVLFWRLRSRVGTTAYTLNSPTWQFIVGARSAAVGASSGTTLDVNGDGYADIVVGANTDNGGTGSAYVFLGGASGLVTPVATTLNGPDGDMGDFGGSVASAGDVNGDGYADVLIGAHGANTFTGAAYVYLGGAGGLATSAATHLTGPDGTVTHFGASVSSAGDVNGDGYADVVIGAYWAAGHVGRAHIYLGGPTGLATSPATSLTGPDPAGGVFGDSVASAGDVNADGYGDLLIGADGANRAYVHLGSAAGVVTTAQRVLTNPGAGSSFGQAVSSAGDVNGDGYADVLIGSNTANRAYVYLGGASGVAATVATTLVDPDGGATDAFGVAVASAGDLNGDGYSDVVIGAENANSGVGRVHVYLGASGGLATAPATSLTGLDSSGYFGGSVAGAGDVNRDGYGEVVIGAGSALFDYGRVYLHLGRATGLTSAPATTLDGPSGMFAYFGTSVF